MGNGRLFGFQIRYTKCAYSCGCVVGTVDLTQQWIESVFGTGETAQVVPGRVAYACNFRTDKTGTEEFQDLLSNNLA